MASHNRRKHNPRKVKQDIAREALKARVARRRPKGMPEAEWRALPAVVRFRVAKALENAEAKSRFYRDRAIALAKDLDADAFGATPETTAALRAENQNHHPILSLFISGDLSRDDLNAAYEIAYAYRMRTADVWVNLASYEARIDSGGWRESPPDTKNQARIQAAYMAWTRRVNNQRISLNAMLELIVYGTSFRRVAVAFQIPRTTLRVQTIRAIHAYDPNPGRKSGQPVRRSVPSATTAAKTQDTH